MPVSALKTFALPKVPDGDLKEAIDLQGIRPLLKKYAFPAPPSDPLVGVRKQIYHVKPYEGQSIEYFDGRCIRIMESVLDLQGVRTSLRSVWNGSVEFPSFDRSQIDADVEKLKNEVSTLRQAFAAGVKRDAEVLKKQRDQQGRQVEKQFNKTPSSLQLPKEMGNFKRICEISAQILTYQRLKKKFKDYPPVFLSVEEINAHIARLEKEIEQLNQRWIEELCELCKVAEPTLLKELESRKERLQELSRVCSETQSKMNEMEKVLKHLNETLSSLDSVQEESLKKSQGALREELKSSIQTFSEAWQKMSLPLNQLQESIREIQSQIAVFSALHHQAQTLKETDSHLRKCLELEAELKALFPEALPALSVEVDRQAPLESVQQREEQLRTICQKQGELEKLQEVKALADTKKTCVLDAHVKRKIVTDCVLRCLQWAVLSACILAFALLIIGVGVAFMIGPIGAVIIAAFFCPLIAEIVFLPGLFVEAISFILSVFIIWGALIVFGWWYEQMSRLIHFKGHQ